MATRTKRTRLLAALLCALLVALMLPALPTVGYAASDTVVYLSNSGDDANDGSTQALAVKTLDRALALADGGTIIVGSQQTINADKTLENATFRRAEGFTSTMFLVTGNAKLTLQNVTLDGANVAKSSYLVQASRGTTLNIGANAVLENNQSSAVYAYGATVNMTDGTIRNNKVEGDGGGMYLFNSTAVLSGGVIEGNQAVINQQDRGGSGAGVLGYGSTKLTISGTNIRNNTGARDGGGVYMWTSDASGQDASFSMTGGAVSGNKTPDGYAGIYLSSYGSDIKASITGGTIAGNTNQDGQDTAIQLTDMNEKYIVLELGGTANITGEILIMDNYDVGPYILVTSDLQVKAPIPVRTVYYNPDLSVIRYAEGVTPDLNDFVPAAASQGIAIDGQNLVWVKKINVTADTMDWATGKWVSHSGLYMMPGLPLDQSLLPQAADYPGYERIGWQINENGKWVLFDMERVLTMDDDKMRLYEVWALNAPTDVEITADTTKAHPGQTITLKAGAAHELEGMVYNYAWYKDGVLLDGQNGATLAVTEPGSYTVKVSASNGKTTSAEAESAPVEVAFGHFIDDVWQSDDHNHWQACTECGEKLNLGAHISDGGKVTTEATETTEGVKTYACTVCGKVLKTEAIPVLASPNGANGVKTGDLSQPVLWTALLVLAAAGVGGTVLYRKKNHA